LALDYPWGIAPDEAIDIAIECENKAREFDKISNSDGATVNTSRSTSIYGNTHGFVGNYTSTRHNISCAVIAEQDGAMQRDYWFTTSRNPEDLESATSVGEHTYTVSLRGCPLKL
ncbi:MAG: metalloprotease PmbA, partial [Chloroflexi bacterium]|nr:metalloprotease PmbA [Chloroflexota bacterium]